MKLNKFFMGILGAMALSACSSEEVIPDKPNIPEEELNSRFMTVSIRNSEGQTRAGGDQSGDLYEEGLDQENAVKSIRFYFFDKDGNPYKVSYTGKNYFDCTEIVTSGQDMPNVEKKLKAVIVLTSDNEKEDFSGINSMVAIANFEELTKGATDGNNSLTDENKSLAELKDIVGNFYELGSTPALESDYRFVMTSSSFGAKQDATSGNYPYGCETFVDGSTKIKPTREEAEGDPVEIYVERLVAKVRVSTAWSESMDTKKVMFNGQEYIAVKLKERKNNVTSDIQANDKDVYVIMTAWDLSGHTDKSYLFKQVNPTWEFPNWTWNNPAFHRSHWAMNAQGVKHLRRKHSEAVAKIGSRRQSGSSQPEGDSDLVTYDGDVLYTQENAADYSENILENSGKKYKYDPETEVSNLTQAYIKGVLVQIDENNIATPINLAIWGDIKYLESDLLVAMYSTVNNLIYTRDAEPYDEKTEIVDGKEVKVKLYHYHSLPVKAVMLKNAQYSAGQGGNNNMATDENEISRRYLSYIQLKDGDKIAELLSDQNAVVVNNKKTDVVYYQPIQENGKTIYKEMSRTDVDKILSNMPGAKVWRGGDTYYYVDLMHLNTAEGADEIGRYGIVRNHIYDVEINTVYGLGTPVLIPGAGEGEELDIIPQKPSKDAFYLGARLNILSWRVVRQDVSLDWD